jgi:hypothetical protein
MRQAAFAMPADKSSDVPARRKSPRSCRLLLMTWAVLSVLWVVGVGYNIYQRVSTQADMSRDVEHDLDLVSCNGPNCSDMPDEDNSPTESKLEIIGTYLKFGSVDMAEFTIGPPTILFVLVICGIVMIRRRHAQMQKPD